MQIPAWFKKPTKAAPPPTLEELKERLRTARADHAAAGELLVGARARLDAERTAPAIEGVREAKQHAEDLGELLTVCESDVARAEEEQRKAAQLELEREEAAIDARFKDGTARTTELEDAWFRTFVAVVQGYEKLREHGLGQRDLGFQLAGIRSRLGKSYETPSGSFEPRLYEPASRLAQHQFPPDSRGFACELARLLAPNARF